MSATAPLDRDASAVGTALPEGLTSPNAKLVYLYLATADGGSVGDLASALRLKTITLYPVLQSLEAHDLVERNGETYRPVAA